MVDIPVGQDVAAQAQELSDTILAKLDDLTLKSTADGSESSGTTLEQYKQLAQVTIEKIKGIVAGYMEHVNTQQTATKQERAAVVQEEINRIKAGIGS